MKRRLSLGDVCMGKLNLIKQDVNLVHLFPKQKLRHPNLIDITIVAIIVAVIMVVISGFYYWGGLEKEQVLLSKQQQQQKLIEKVSTLKNKEQGNAGVFVGSLKSDKFKDYAPFYDKFKELASRPLLGVWLTRLVFDNDNQFARLQGHAITTPAIISFVKTLYDYRAFNSVDFTTLIIDTPEGDELLKQVNVDYLPNKPTNTTGLLINKLKTFEKLYEKDKTKKNKSGNRKKAKTEIIEPKPPYGFILQNKRYEIPMKKSLKRRRLR